MDRIHLALEFYKDQILKLLPIDFNGEAYILNLSDDEYESWTESILNYPFHVFNETTSKQNLKFYALLSGNKEEYFSELFNIVEFISSIFNEISEYYWSTEMEGGLLMIDSSLAGAKKILTNISSLNEGPKTYSHFSLALAIEILKQNNGSLYFLQNKENEKELLNEWLDKHNIIRNNSKTSINILNEYTTHVRTKNISSRYTNRKRYINAFSDLRNFLILKNLYDETKTMFLKMIDDVEVKRDFFLREELNLE